MARMDDDAQQPVGRCGTSIHPQEDRQDHVIDLTVKQVARTHARTLAYSHPSDTDSQSVLSSPYSLSPPSFPSFRFLLFALRLLSTAYSSLSL